MQILRADEMGMCFGVRDALAALAAVPQPADVTIHGELVHNPEVLRLLDRRGFHRAGEGERGAAMPPTPVVAITAHGVSDRERARLAAAGKQLVDTTCPLVQKAHAAARELAAEGRRLVVLGKRDHVEVRGIVEDHDGAIVVGAVGDVARWPEARLGVVAQTTTQVEVADALVAAIRAANRHADVRVIDTICSPTKARVDALLRLLPRIDALVVVGGRDSNNTRQLVLRGEHHGVRTCRVANAGELDADWFDGARAVGVTAGTSTLARTIEEVHGWLVRLAAARAGRTA
jgi:4-hydroxy-3-methylbut-2-enyl diphosphate reductase